MTQATCNQAGLAAGTTARGGGGGGASALTLKRGANRKVADIWGQVPPEQAPAFWDLPIVQQYLLDRISGEPGRALEPGFTERWTVRTYLGDRLPIDRMASLCCGFGSLERNLAGIGAFREAIGIDLSEGAIKGAREQAAAAGYDHIKYEVGDLNTLELEPESFDLIYANGAIHHITNLEHLFEQVKRALRPGGVFACNEYVGPKYQGFDDRQVEIINAAIHLLPHRYRTAFESSFVPPSMRFPAWKRKAYCLMRTLMLDPVVPNMATHASKPHWPAQKALMFGIYQRLWRAVRGGTEGNGPRRFGRVWDQRSDYLKAVDPSEGVRSDEILPVLQTKFERIDVRPLGLSVIPQVMDREFLDRYRGDSAEDRALFEMLLKIEDTLAQLGDLEADYAHIVAVRSPE